MSLNPTSTPRSRPSQSPIGHGYNSQLPSPAAQHAHAASRFVRGASEMGPPVKSVDNLEPWIKQAAKTCIEAAIRSTTAFDAVPERLIITNIFGTAHAQFGNMLVLAATYNSDLSYLVDENILRELFERTLKFLKLSDGVSPILRYDAEILRHVRATIFPDSYGSNSAASSFSSK